MQKDQIEHLSKFTYKSIYLFHHSPQSSGLHEIQWHFVFCQCE